MRWTALALLPLAAACGGARDGGGSEEAAPDAPEGDGPAGAGSETASPPRPAPVCPPPPPYGRDVGDTVEPLPFEDCDGQRTSTHDLCGADATLIFNFYGW